MRSQKDGKTTQASRCIKLRITNKVIYDVISIDTFERQCVVLKGMLQSPQLIYHIQTIGIDQYLSNNALYEHKCLENIKKYTNKLVIVTTRNISKIFSRLLWFLLLKDSPMTVLYIPWHQHLVESELVKSELYMS